MASRFYRAPVPARPAPRIAAPIRTISQPVIIPTPAAPPPLLVVTPGVVRGPAVSQPTPAPAAPPLLVTTPGIVRAADVVAPLSPAAVANAVANAPTPEAVAAVQAPVAEERHHRHHRHHEDQAAQQQQGSASAPAQQGGSGSGDGQQNRNEEWQEREERDQDRQEERQERQQEDDQPQEQEQEQQEQAPSDDMSGEGSELAGMRVSLSIHDGKLHVLGVCETPWGSIPVACQFGIEGNEADRNVSLNVPQNPAVLAALGVAERNLDVLARKETADLAVENLVRRARLGDQNAMAMIAETKNCASTRPLAAAMFKKIKAYIDLHPYDGSTIGAETSVPKASASASTTLANGPPLSKVKLLDMARSFSGPGHFAAAFLYGCSNYCKPTRLQQIVNKHPASEGALRAGATAGLARAIQRVRLPDSVIAHFCPAAAWELGE